MKTPILTVVFSFLCVVASIAQSAITISGGATVSGAGRFITTNTVTGGGGGGFTQIQTQGNDSDNNGLSTFAGNQILYSSFVTSTADTITKIRVRLSKTGSPTFNIVLRLYTDSGGSGPTLTQVGSDSIETLSSATLTGSAADYDFTFSGLSVSTTTKYWVAAVASGVGDGSNFVRWYGNPAGTGQQWRTVIDGSGGAEVQASMDGSLTTFKTP